jgi:hyperosmotically inducible periplasmic protein
MSGKIRRGCAGLLLLAAAVGVHAQGGGQPVSPAQASEIVARKASDKQLVTAVTSALTGANVDVSSVRVKAYNGVVTMRGSVPTEDQRQAATLAAAKVQGVKSVKNRLSLRH